MNPIKLKIKKLYEDVILPHYKREGDAGMDVYSREDKTLNPGEKHIFKLGFATQLEPGFVTLIWDRSGMGCKGIKSLGGVIDHTYRGEYGVILVNTIKEPIEIKKGDRIAQLLIQPICTAQMEVVDEISDSVRGEGAYGSSGR